MYLRCTLKTEQRENKKSKATEGCALKSVHYLKAIVENFN